MRRVEVSRSGRVAQPCQRKIEKLVRMANQIADFFVPYPEEEAVAGIQQHIRSFWTPHMRAELLAFADAGGQGPKPRVISALTRLRAGPKPDQQSDRRPGEARPGDERRGMSASDLAEMPAEVPLPPPAQQLRRLVYRSGETSEGLRTIAEETAVALSYGGSTHAVMMATPAGPRGFRRRLQPDRARHRTRVRNRVDGGRAARKGCRHPDVAGDAARRGPCRPPPASRRADGLRTLRHRQPVGGYARAAPGRRGYTAGHQFGSGSDRFASFPTRVLNRQTGAVHAAGFWRPSDRARRAARGRRPAQRARQADRSAGAAGRQRRKTASLLLTSRVSVEMVQKAAVLGAGILVAVSAPTALAIRMAEAAGITLVAIARRDGFEVFTHPHRIISLE